MKTATPEVLPAVFVDPAEFGLDADKAAEVESVFLPVVTERDLLAENYAVITGQEITLKTTQQARDLRLKLVKLRTNTDRIHKAAKAFYLAGGRFVDAWKNKNVVVIEQMEEKLEDIELYFVRIEMELQIKLADERKELLSAFTTEFPENLGIMPQAVFDAYLTGLKVAHEAKLAEEKRLEDERIEQERILSLHKARKESILKLWQYVDPEIEYSNFGAMSDEKWADTVAILAGRKKKQDDENERIRLDNEAKRIENERLQAEADKKAKELEVERKKVEAEKQKAEEAARIEREKAEAELAKQKAEAEAEAEKKDKEIKAVQAAADAKIAEQLAIAEAEAKRLADLASAELRAAEAQRLKLEAEIQAQKDAEAALLREKEKAEKDKLAQEEAAKKGPDKEKLKVWVDSMLIRALPSENMSDDSIKVANEIFTKFSAFKKWAIGEIEKL